MNFNLKNLKLLKMKKDILNKIALSKKSNNLYQEIKSEKAIKSKKILKKKNIIIPKLKTNFLTQNQKQEKQNLFERALNNINLYNNKEKKLLLNSINNINKNKNIANKDENLINENEKESLCNTDRSNKNNNKDNNNTSLNINTNNNNDNKNKSLKLLLSAKNITKKYIFKTKSKNIIANMQIMKKEISNDYKSCMITKNKSSKNLNNQLMFTKIKMPKNNKNEATERNNIIVKKQNNKRKKTLESKMSLEILENDYPLKTLPSYKSFFHRNNTLTSSSGIKLPRYNKTMTKNRENIESNDINNLDTIFEDYKKNNGENHHYLENTISAKNKMVRKRKTDILETNDGEKFSKISRKKLTNIINKEFHHEKIDKMRINNFKSNNIQNNTKVIDNNNIVNRNSINITKRRTKSIENNNKKNNNDISGSINTENTKKFKGKIEDYLITKELGKGSCAVVKLGTHKITKDKFAIKIYTKEFLLDPQKRNVVKNEINILKQLDNEYIMKLYEEIDTPNYLYLVLEYINGIPLIDIINNEDKNFLSQNRAKKLIIQIIKGIIYLHSKNICHRDIKLENILVMKNDKIKIIDFGFAVKCNKDTYQKLFCGTPSYMAPEILNKDKYNPYYSDIWSLGVLFYAMVYGKFPFDFKKNYDDDEFEEFKEINLRFYDEIKIDDDIKDIFKRIFIFEPKERIKLNEILDILSKDKKL